MADEPKPIYTSRSQYNAGMECQMSRALEYHYSEDGTWSGPGLQPVSRPNYFALGTLIHDTLESLAQGVDPEALVATIWEFAQDADKLDWGAGETNTPSIMAREWCTYTEAVMWAWNKYRLPDLLAEYEVVAVEGELAVDLGTIYPPTSSGGRREGHRLIWQSRPDIVWRRRRDDGLFVMDVKTSGSRDTAAQIEVKLQHSTLVHAQMASLEASMGESAIGFLYEGVYKGYQEKKPHRDIGYKRQMTPFIYVYFTPGDGLSDPVMSDSNWRSGKPTMLCNLPMTIKDYIEGLPSAVVLKQFVVPPPLGIDPRKVDQWKAQVPVEETRWVAPQEPFPMNDNHCFRYGVKRRCHFVPLCYTEATRKDPIGSGEYAVRVPHHEVPTSPMTTTNN